MNKTIRQYLPTLLALSALIVGLTACQGTEDVPYAVELPGEQNHFSDPLVGAVSLMKANSQDITDNRVQCRGKDNGKVCVEICHRPPGNPANAKTKVLPLPAVFAHLNHGNPTVPDTIGPCDGLPYEGGQGDGGDTGDDGGMADGGDDGEGDYEGELPVWCEENLDIDPDCDGMDEGPIPEPIY